MELLKTDYAYDDAATRRALREIVIPRLWSARYELAECRRMCDQRADWAESWKDAGMVDDEKHLSDALRTIEARLKAYNSPNHKGDL